MLRKSIKSTNRVYQKCLKDIRERLLDINGEPGVRLKDHYKKTFKWLMWLIILIKRKVFFSILVQRKSINYN